MKLILDADALAAIVAAEQSGRLPFEQMTPQEARSAYRRGCALTGPPPRQMSRVDEGEWAGPGGALRYRLYRPSLTPDLPALLYLHGGGWVIGDLDSHDGCAAGLPPTAAARCWRWTTAWPPSTRSPPRLTMRWRPGWPSARRPLRWGWMRPGWA